MLVILIHTHNFAHRSLFLKRVETVTKKYNNSIKQNLTHQFYPQVNKLVLNRPQRSAHQTVRNNSPAVSSAQKRVTSPITDTSTLCSNPLTQLTPCASQLSFDSLLESDDDDFEPLSQPKPQPHEALRRKRSNKWHKKKTMAKKTLST